MFDRELLLDILLQIELAIEKILYRFSPIHTPEEFTNTQEGMEKLDAICMQLIAIGESVKNIDKIAGKEFLAKYDSVDWRGVKGMRDVISHHYFDIDAEAIFEVCSVHIPELKRAIHQVIADLRNNA